MHLTTMTVSKICTKSLSGSDRETAQAPEGSYLDQKVLI